MLKEYENLTRDSNYILKNYLVILLSKVYILCRTDGKSSQEVNVLIKQIMQEVSDNIQEELTLAYIANKVHMAPKYLSRFFKQQTGQTFIEFVHEKRMAEACRLLEQTDMAVNVLNVRSTIAEFCFYMSDNGINFYKIGSVNASGLTAMHNAGMAGNGYGHIDLEQPVIMGYAYQESNGTWGQWPTAISYLTIRQVEKIVEKDFIETYAKDPVWETEPAAFAFTTLHDTNENVPLSGCAPENVLDGNSNSKYYSATMEYEFQGQAIAIGTPGSFSQITVQPVGSMVHFPVDFRFQYSDDGIIFYDIEGASYTNYSISSSEPITFKFGKKVTAKYVRLLATKLSKDSFGTYALEIAEMSVK